MCSTHITIYILCRYIVPWHAICMPKKTTSLYTENTSINLARFRQNLDSESTIQPNELHTLAEKPSSCYAVTTFEVRPPTFPHKQQVATQILDGKKIVARQIKNQEASTSFSQISEEPMTFDPDCPENSTSPIFLPHPGSFGRKRATAQCGFSCASQPGCCCSVSLAFCAGFDVEAFCSLFPTWFTLSTPSIKTLLFIIPNLLNYSKKNSAPSSPLPYMGVSKNGGTPKTPQNEHF